MTWAIKRQILDVGVVIILLSFFGYLIISPYLNRTPTCTDNKQNGDETGVDCGGLCTRACIAQVDPISVLWSRAFRVVPGRYNAVAYLENHNQNAMVEKINYRFRFADERNIYIGKREGSTYIPPSGHFAVFEPAIDVGHSIPVFTTFEFTESPDWLQVSKDKVNQLKILVSNINLIDEKTNPRLSANIKNNSLFIIPQVDVVAILYDADHNAVSVSRTYLDKLNGEENSEVNFTWPEPLPGVVVAKEILPMFNISLVKLK